MQMIDELRSAAVQMFPEAPTAVIEDMAVQAGRVLLSAKDVGGDFLRTLTLLEIANAAVRNAVKGEIEKQKEP